MNDERKNENPVLVSIRCQTYNHKLFIQSALDGFLIQRTNFRYQVIVVDDASNDGAQEIIKRYSEMYPDIIKAVLLKENHFSQHKSTSEYYEQFEKGVKYIGLCEGDDYWIDPNKLQRQYDYLESHASCSMVFHNAFQINISDKGHSAQLFNSFDRDQDLTMEDAINKWLVPTASMLFRSEYVKFPSWVPALYSTDLTMVLLFMDYGNVHYLNTISSVYRRITRTGSQSMTAVMGGLFVMRQHLSLFTSYNEGTDYKYNDLVSKRIDYLRREIAFHEIKETKRYWRYLLMIPLIFRKIFRNLKERF